MGNAAKSEYNLIILIVKFWNSIISTFWDLLVLIFRKEWILSSGLDYICNDYLDVLGILILIECVYIEEIEW